MILIELGSSNNEAQRGCISFVLPMTGHYFQPCHRRLKSSENNIH